MSFQFSNDYKYVVGTLSLIPFFSIYLGATVFIARKGAHVKLPLLFASEADAAVDFAKHQFNCTQKSAMNFQENACSFVIATLISGLTFPRLTAIGVLSRLSGRYLYHKSYFDGNPKDRFNGKHGSCTYIIITFLALYGAVSNYAVN